MVDPPIFGFVEAGVVAASFRGAARIVEVRPHISAVVVAVGAAGGPARDVPPSAAVGGGLDVVKAFLIGGPVDFAVMGVAAGGLVDA